jgi:hypothetical protein
VRDWGGKIVPFRGATEGEGGRRREKEGGRERKCRMGRGGGGRRKEEEKGGRGECKRNLLQCEKRPITVSKETYYSVKRDLLQCQKRPITEGRRRRRQEKGGGIANRRAALGERKSTLQGPLEMSLV